MLITFVALLFVSAPAEAGGQAHAGHNSVAHRQAEVASRGAEVMPFALDRTMHRFVPNERGGVQSVVSTDGDPEQVRLIREHLSAERERFARGDFASPAATHGADMPGLATLAAARGRVSVAYADVPAGGELRFRSSEPTLVAAVHAWFAAQAHDHGRHAEQGHSH
jgi:hypothetical protein